MLTPDDRRAIEGLFDRLAEAERQAPQRDREAEDLIRQELGRQPAAPYYMAQTIVVQQQALAMAEARIEELEAAATRSERGGLFGGMFDDNRGGRGTVARRQTGGPWDRQSERGRDEQVSRGGGGFLAGAAQTALGVAGGVLLGNAIASMFGAGAAHAAEPQSNDADASSDNAQDQPDNAADDTGFDSGGGFGDDGGFDMGGDF